MKERQLFDPEYSLLKEKIESNKINDLSMKFEEDVIYFRGRIWIPGDEALKKKLLEEANSSRYTFHLVSTKI